MIFDPTINLGSMTTMVVGGWGIGRAVLSLRDSVRDLATEFRVLRGDVGGLSTIVTEHGRRIERHHDALVEMGWRNLNPTAGQGISRLWRCPTPTKEGP